MENLWQGDQQAVPSRDLSILRQNMIGASPAYVDALRLILRIARCDATALVQGETGTGKELAARAIHYTGPRRCYPFVAVNCGAISDGLTESMLFGHSKGAFTDARSSHAGFIAQAHRGTLFLDEVEAMTPRAQIALLRFLQDKEFCPVGSDKPVQADVRIIAASNQDLKGMAVQGEIRSDLYYRLAVLVVTLPALRERRGDPVLLAEAFAKRFAEQYRMPEKHIDDSSKAALDEYLWPGNVRELENLVHRECLLSDGTTLSLTQALKSDTERIPATGFRQAKAAAIGAFERQYLTGLMTQTRGNVTIAAQRAGTERSAFSRLLRKHGLTRSQFL